MSADAPPPPYPGNEKGGIPPPSYPQYHQMFGQPAQYNIASVQSGQTTVVLTQPACTVIQCFRDVPLRIKCQFCQADVVTSTFYETGILTWVACLAIAIIGGTLGCFLIPFCLNACKDVVHECPNCHQQVGRYDQI